jgi:hypothetical protein
LKICLIYPAVNPGRLNPTYRLIHPVINEPKSIDKIDRILNNSFGILDISSPVDAGRLEKQDRRYYWMANGVYLTKEQIRVSIPRIAGQLQQSQ